MCVFLSDDFAGHLDYVSLLSLITVAEFASPLTANYRARVHAALILCR